MTSFLKNKTIRLFAVVVLMVFAVAPILVNHMANAATLGQVMVRFDSIEVSTTTTGVVCAKPAADATVEGKVAVTFPTGFVLGAFGTFTVDTTTNTASWPAGAAAWTGITAPTGAGDIVGQTVTFGSGNLASHLTLYCFNWTNAAAVTNPGSPSATLTGTVATETAASAPIDSATYTTNVIADSTIQVNATVPQAFSFVLGGGMTDNLGALSTGSVASSAPAKTVTINTNSKNGWQVWAKDSNSGLNSASAGKTINSSARPSTLANNAEGYNMGVVKSQVGGTGVISVDAGFDQGVTPYKGGGLDTTMRTIASSNGTADTAVLTLENHAAIGPLTPAATDYTDIITVTGAGLF